MAHIQEYLEPSEPYTSSLLSRSRFLYDLGSSAATCAEVSIAPPVLQSPFSPGNHMLQSQWPMPQTPISSFSARTNNMVWEQQLASTDSMSWTELPNVPLMDESLLANSNLLYGHGARQNMLDAYKDFETSLWVTNGMNNTAPGPSADVMMSPVSPFGDVEKTEGPSPDCNPDTPGESSASYISSSGVPKVSLSPGFVPPTPRSITRPQSQSSAVRSAFGVPSAFVGPPPMDNIVEQNGNVPIYGSEYSYGQSQGSSPGGAQWLPPGYVTEKATLARGYQQNHSSRSRFDLRPNSFLASLDRSSRQRQTQWSNTPDVPAQSHFQSRFLTPLTDVDNEQRAKDDDTLLQMKRDGHTYRDIRKALGRKVAESTLRGRYRSLTKPRKDRLRAPKWTETDIALLKRYVNDEFDRLDETHPSLETKQKPDKVPWMRIVDLIASNGGSYKFGAATAKKKWFEVTRPALTRSLRRRSQA